MTNQLREAAEVIDNGGPAFPGGEAYDTTDLAGHKYKHRKAPSNPGMTLRDYFAARAMVQITQGRLKSPYQWLRWCFGLSIATCGIIPSVNAKQAYEMADAMLAERSK